MAIRKRLSLTQAQAARLMGSGDNAFSMKARRYADKYRGVGEPIHLVAVEFSRETRNVTTFGVERA